MDIEYDEVLSVKLCCAGVIICNAVMVILLMSHFIQTSSQNDDITNFRHYFTYAGICIISICLAYLVERGNKICWIISVLTNIAGLINIFIEFELVATMIIGTILIIITVILLMMPPVCKKCGIPVLKRIPWPES